MTRGAEHISIVLLRKTTVEGGRKRGHNGGHRVSIRSGKFIGSPRARGTSRHYKTNRFPPIQLGRPGL